MVDFSEDLFTRVKSINFGSGNWLFISMGVHSPSALPPSFSLEADFVGEAGGTPGFVTDASGVSNPTYSFPESSGGTHTLVKSDLTAILRTSAGADFGGISIGYQPGATGDPVDGMFLVRLNHFSAPFRVRLRKSISPTFFANAGIEISTISEKTIKAGQKVPDGLTFVATASTPVSPAVTDFIIDPTTLSITGPL